MLTPQQKKAVDSDSREILCIAGAGAGKTTVLVERICRLVDEGFSLDNFLVLTFTRAAANNLAAKLETKLADKEYPLLRQALNSMLVGTFHALALRMLMVDGAALGYQTETLTVINPADADLLLTYTCQKLGFKAPTKYGKWKHGLSFRKVAHAREALYNGTLASTDKNISLALKSYQETLYSFNAMDYGSILLQCQKLLTIPEILAKYHSQVKHVLVDELQDTDTMQYNLHDFFSPPANFFAVGDVRQTLYTWRGARPDMFFQKHADAEIIQLPDNFRSGSAIVKAANNLIAHNQEHNCEPMVSRRGDKGSIYVTNDPLNFIRQRLDEGFACEDIAVLARKHEPLEKFEEQLTVAKIPVHRIGKTAQDTGDFLRLHAALRLICNPRDNLATLRLHHDLATKMSYSKIRECAADTGGSHIAAAHALNPTKLSTLLVGEVPTSSNGFEGARPLTPQATVDDCLLTLVDAFQDSQSLLPVAKFWWHHAQGMTFQQAITWYATWDMQDDLTDDNKIQLMTVHAAKGLEFPCVLVLGLDSGEFPSYNTEDGLRDERRVAYVAATRPQELLGLHFQYEPSQFLAELQGDKSWNTNLPLTPNSSHV